MSVSKPGPERTILRRRLSLSFTRPEVEEAIRELHAGTGMSQARVAEELIAMALGLGSSLSPEESQQELPLDDAMDDAMAAA
ncbi:hypothetical protein ACIBKY_51495 [Nonomuraea sp. NPDC050394]|uniref:hypothetical protein n=1 Tax=Nonomuraea sp. NPDC050394 TaxID=3364363 RepID=UPI0037A1F823